MNTYTIFEEFFYEYAKQNIETKLNVVLSPSSIEIEQIEGTDVNQAHRDVALRISANFPSKLEAATQMAEFQEMIYGIKNENFILRVDILQTRSRRVNTPPSWLYEAIVELRINRRGTWTI